jgi:PTH1 family peptidyl-tRNA hydrolase
MNDVLKKIQIKAVVALGNPGNEYQFTRHNVGFLFLKTIFSDKEWTFKKKWNALSCQNQWGKDQKICLLPQTFMNLSGQSVREMCRFYNFTVENLLVIHDDVDLPLGANLFKKGGSHGGHNGLKSIEQELGSSEFFRLRIGIGRQLEMGSLQESKNTIPLNKWVLQNFQPFELEKLENVFQHCRQALNTWFFEEDNFSKITMKYNRRKYS